MKIAVCVIARNEAETIGSLTSQLAVQSLLAQPHVFQLVVIANGCTDGTVIAACEAFEKEFSTHPAQRLVHDTPFGGKARSWNLAVHELIEEDCDIVIFIDADIELIDNMVLEELVAALAANEALLAVSGHPVKDIQKKPHKSLIDLFSLSVSDQARTPHSINGSLYAARMLELSKIWLPTPTPGEDGLLSAMIHTDGFSRRPRLAVIDQIARPTHYFEAHSVLGFFRHETRMIVGTVINGWICEFLWAGSYKENAGALIRDRNERDPLWVSRLVESRVGDRRWVLPRRMLTWRLHNLRGIGIARAVARAPLSLAATLLNFWPALRANRTLKSKNPANYW